HPDRRIRDLQAARRRDRRPDPQVAPARAVQGQGHPLPGRARDPQGREAGMSQTRLEGRLRRHRRVRKRVTGSAERPRLAVYRSNRGIAAQLIDDVAGRTLAAASHKDKSLAGKARAEAPAAVGKLVAERGREAGIASVVFDRGGYLYHGRVKALADAARENGLEF